MTIASHVITVSTSAVVDTMFPTGLRLLLVLIGYHCQICLGDSSSVAVDPLSIFRPLLNDQKDLDRFNAYWPMRHDDFVPELATSDNYGWAVVLCQKRSSPDNNNSNDNNNNTDQNLLRDPIAVDEIDNLRRHIEQKLYVTKAANDAERIYYKHICLSYTDGGDDTDDGPVCGYPTLDLNFLKSDTWQFVQQTVPDAVRFPFIGNAKAPFGRRAYVGVAFGDVELDRKQQPESLDRLDLVALRFFFRRFVGDLGDDDQNERQLSADLWRQSLRNYVLDEYVSGLLDVRYLDDELMRRPLNAATRANSRLLDPRLLDAGLWPQGQQLQVLFNNVPDVSRRAERQRLLNAVESFEQTEFSFGPEGTVCWLRTFDVWRRSFSDGLYGQIRSSIGNNNNNNRNVNDTTTTIDDDRSPFGSFDNDLRTFLHNPAYPVFGKQLVIGDRCRSIGTGVDRDQRLCVEAFRCSVMLKNLYDAKQRLDVVQRMRAIVAEYPHYNISLAFSDFFPPVALKASINYVLAPVVLALCFLISWIVTLVD